MLAGNLQLSHCSHPGSCVKVALVFYVQKHEISYSSLKAEEKLLCCYKITQDIYRLTYVEGLFAHCGLGCQVTLDKCSRLGPVLEDKPSLRYLL